MDDTDFQDFDEILGGLTTTDINERIDFSKRRATLRKGIATVLGLASFTSPFFFLGGEANDAYLALGILFTGYIGAAYVWRSAEDHLEFARVASEYVTRRLYQ